MPTSQCSQGPTPLQTQGTAPSLPLDSKSESVSFAAHMVCEMSPGPASPGPLWGISFPVIDGATCQEHLSDFPHCGSGKALGVSGLFCYVHVCNKWGQQGFCGGLFLETRTWYICAAEMTGLTWSQ